MQVGIDVGATKIVSVVLEKDGHEKHRSRISCPKNYTQIITAIRDIPVSYTHLTLPTKLTV